MEEKEFRFNKDLYVLKCQIEKLMIEEIDLWEECPERLVCLLAELHCELDTFLKGKKNGISK